MKFLSGIALLFLATQVVFASDLDVARQALRDGLWDVARTHAARVEGDEAKLIVLESYCREGQWAAALNVLNSWTNADSPTFVYYRALLLFETGQLEQAKTALSSVEFKDEHTANLATRLKARLALVTGRANEALDILKVVDFEKADVDSRMAAADILASAGDLSSAERLWRGVAADTNASERVFVTAAVNLADPVLLREASARVKDTTLRRLAGIRLGWCLLGEAKTFDEGAMLIQAIAKDAPDTVGAREAFVALADALLTAKRYSDAADAYRQALEIWPQLALQSHVQEGRGWAFRQLGRADDALEAFARAEETATNDVMRATAILEQGDVLSESGRGEEALAKYRLVLEKYPQTPAGEKLKVIVELRELESKGRDLFKNYDFAAAQKIFQEVAAKDSARQPRMDYYRVLCLYGQGLDQEAYEQATALMKDGKDPSIRAEATLWLAKFSYNRRRWKDACRLFALYADLRPKAPASPSALTWAARAAFADNDFLFSIRLVSRLAEQYPDSAEKVRGYLVQGEALIELARFDEAVLVLERVDSSKLSSAEERVRAKILRADALFAMGADHPVRYREALRAYQSVRLSENLSPSLRLSVSFKIGRTLEKLNRLDEAIDQYYASVVLAYREGRMKNVRFDDEARATFARAAFRLADEYESRGKDFQAMHILELVVASDVPAADEAEKRIDRIQTKGSFL